MDRIKITEKDGTITFLPIPNKEQFINYVESKNSRSIRFWVAPGHKIAINLDNIRYIEVVEEENLTDESELNF